MTVIVYRGIGHPWTAAPGWDQMLLGADDDSLDTLQQLIDRAKEKFWKVWFVSEATVKAHMFKPSEATCEWQDISWQGTPRGHGHQFKVGDEVYTDFTGKVTHHRITEIQFTKITQTGVTFRVSPRLHSSVFGDDGQERRGNPWIDAAWFRKVES